MTQTAATDTRHGYLKQLDGLRFIAVLGVMIAHWTFKYSAVNRFTMGLGINGVNLFFVLSGFLITRILLVNKDASPHPISTLKPFYIRRALRIFPLYYLVLLIAFIFDIPTTRPIIGWLLTYTANIRSFFGGTDFKWLIHFWSLSVEEQFYIFFPLLVLVTPKKHLLKLFVSLTLLAIVSRIFVFGVIRDKGNAEWVSFAFTPCCFDCFAIGAILAYLYLYNQTLLKKILKYTGLFWICFAISFVTYYVWFQRPESYVPIVSVRFFFALFSFWLIGKASFADFNKAFSAFLNNPTVIYFGKISYGLYIIHNFMQYLYGNLQFPGIEFLYFATTVALASLSWKYFELPMNNLKKYFKYA